MHRDDELTVGELARRTGLSVKGVSRYEALGLISYDRIAEPTAVRGGIRGYRAEQAAVLAGRPGADLFGEDPRRRQAA